MGRFVAKLQLLWCPAEHRLGRCCFLEPPGPKWFEDGSISTEPRARTRCFRGFSCLGNHFLPTTSCFIVYFKLKNNYCNVTKCTCRSANIHPNYLVKLRPFSQPSVKVDTENTKHVLTTTVDCTWPVAMPLSTYLSCIQKKGLTLKTIIKDVWTKYRGSHMETLRLIHHATFMLQPKLEESRLSWNEGSSQLYTLHVHINHMKNNRNMTSGKLDHTQSKYNIYPFKLLPIRVCIYIYIHIWKYTPS